MSTVPEEFLPKWSVFDVPIPNVQPTAEGEEVGLANLDDDGLELILEIEVEGRGHLVLVDSGASLSVLQPGVSDAELQHVQTAARGITGNKLKTTGISRFAWEARHLRKIF